MFQRPQQIMRQLASVGYTILYEDLGNFNQPSARALSSTFYLCQGIPALTVPHTRPRILWLTVPSHINLISHYKPDLVIYDAVDEPKEEFSSWYAYYPAILKRADLIFASAKSIYEHLSSFHPHVHLVPNGVDNAHFSSLNLPRPTDLPRGKIIIGYSGAIAPWLDWDLLKFVIDKNPHLLFVFVGGLFQMEKFPLRTSNSFYLGLKRYSQLPAYFKHFRIGLIPFKRTEMTRGCNPIKLYEYYAAGLPVLATPLPELLTVPKIQLEADPHRFAVRLGRLAQQPDPDADTPDRLAFAQGNDWSTRAGYIHDKIEEIMRLEGLYTL